MKRAIVGADAVRDHQEYVHRMDEAYVKDLEAFSNGEVVDNRLKMIKDVERSMKNTDFARWWHSTPTLTPSCLSCNLIPVLANWIRPGAHGDLPFSRVVIGVWCNFVDPLGRVQRAAGPSREEEQHQGGEHGRIAGEAVDEQEGDGGEPRAAPPDHREVAATRDGHVRFVPGGGERGLGGHCVGQEGLLVCRQPSSQQGLWALAFPVIRSYGGAGGEVHLRDDAEVGARIAGNE